MSGTTASWVITCCYFPPCFLEPEKSIDDNDKDPINHELLNWDVEIMNNGM